MIFTGLSSESECESITICEIIGIFKVVMMILLGKGRHVQ